MLEKIQNSRPPAAAQLKSITPMPRSPPCAFLMSRAPPGGSGGWYLALSGVRVVAGTGGTFAASVAEAALAAVLTRSQAPDRRMANDLRSMSESSRSEA